MISSNEDEVYKSSRSYDSDNDSIRRYFREISQTPLLTREEVRLTDLMLHPDTSVSEEATERLIKANLRLVARIAKRYLYLGLPYLELVNEGNIGLMEGIKRYRNGKGAKISTYVGHYIQRHINRALSNSSWTIRLPVHICSRIYDLRRAEKELMRKLGRQPRIVELARHLDVSVSSVRFLISKINMTHSLHSEIENTDEKTLLDFVVDTSAPDPSRQTEREMCKEKVSQLLNQLNKRRALIVRMHYGLDGYSEHRIADIAREIRLSNEVVRRHLSRALHNLRVLLRKSLPDDYM